MVPLLSATAYITRRYDTFDFSVYVAVVTLRYPFALLGLTQDSLDRSP